LGILYLIGVKAELAAEQAKQLIARVRQESTDAASQQKILELIINFTSAQSTIRHHRAGNPNTASNLIHRRTRRIGRSAARFYLPRRLNDLVANPLISMNL
jgi:hypothetical protein